MPRRGRNFFGFGGVVLIVWIAGLTGSGAAVVLPGANVTVEDSAVALLDGRAASFATLEELMERYVDGDRVAFDELYRQLSPRLFGYLLRLTRHRERAEDLVQVTFAKVHRARHGYMRGAPLLPWMLAIARRSFFDERRRAKVRPEDLTGDGALPEPHRESEAVGNDMAEALERALASLPPAHAEAIQLTKITGLSIAEAAEVLGTTKTAVKLRVHRGYKILRKELEGYGRDV